MASDKVTVLTDGTFEQTINAGKPVLIDFWAEWCGPCRRLAPTVDELANDYNGKVVVAKMNVDENPSTPMRFSIRGIPTLLLFKGGQLVEQVVGLADKDALKKMLDKHMSREVIVIGSGPAGLTAALYTARANLKPLVIEGLEAGGQLMLTTLVENWPGHKDGVMGPDLMTDMRAQAERFGAEIVRGNVTALDLQSRPFKVTMSDGVQHESRTVILATGATARLLGLPSERRLIGHGVSTCATCDGYFFRGKPIAVIGGGDTAMEEALYLTRFASHVTVIHRRATLRASKVMQDKAFAEKKISFEWNAEVEEMTDVSKGEVDGIRIRNVVTGEVKTLAVDGIFVAIGHTPNTSLIAGQLETDANGYLVTHMGSRTSIPGVFACGDVQDHVYRQAITAAGSGCMAAIDAEKYLEGVPQHLNE